MEASIVFDCGVLITVVALVNTVSLMYWSGHLENYVLFYVGNV